MIKILENFWLKIIALLMGLFIWFHVATEKTYDYELKLPVVYVELQDSLTLAKNPPDSLLVRVVAVGKQLLRQEWHEEGLHINAARYQAGTHLVTLNTANTYLGTAVGSVTLDEVVFPIQCVLEIDRLDQTTVPVTADITAVPDDGFAVAFPIRTIPPEITLHGPKSLLSRFTTVYTEQQELTGLRDNVSLKLPLVVPSSHGVRLEPDSVIVELDVVPVKTRVFEDLPVAVYNVPPEHTPMTDPAMVTIELTGPPTEIDQLELSTLTISADFRQADEYGMSPIKIDFPSNFSVRRQSTASVRIILEPDVDARN